MKQLRIPGKIVLFGEWAVLHGAPGIAFAVDSFCYSQLDNRDLSAPSIWQTPERKALFDLKQSSDDHFLENLMEKTAPTPSNSFSLKSTFDWNPAFGLGTSSALVMSAVGLLSEIPFSTETEKKNFWLKSRQIHRELQGGKSSGIDLAAQLWGGTIALMHDHVQSLELELPAEIIFLHSGHKHSTKAALGRGVPDGLIKSIAASAEKFLKQKDWPIAIQEHQKAFAEANLVDAKTLQLSNALMQSEIPHALKSCGAGGSETLMLWAPTELHSKINHLAKSLDFTSGNHRCHSGGMEAL